MFLGTNGWFDSSTGNTISVLTLSMNRFSKGLYIIVQKGGKEILKQIINASFTAAIEKLPYYTEVIECKRDLYLFICKLGWIRD